MKREWQVRLLVDDEGLKQAAHELTGTDYRLFRFNEEELIEKVLACCEPDAFTVVGVEKAA